VPSILLTKFIQPVGVIRLNLITSGRCDDYIIMPSKYDSLEFKTNNSLIHHKHLTQSMPNCLSQVNDRQNLSATGRYFGFACHNDR